MKKIEEHKVIGEIDAANLMGVSVSKLQADRFYHRGCPYIKLGRRVGYKVSDVLTYLDENRVDPARCNKVSPRPACSQI